MVGHKSKRRAGWWPEPRRGELSTNRSETHLVALGPRFGSLPSLYSPSEQVALRTQAHNLSLSQSVLRGWRATRKCPRWD